MRRRLRLVTSKEQDRLHQLSLQCDFSFVGWEDLMISAEHIIEEMLVRDGQQDFHGSSQCADELYVILDQALDKWKEYIAYRLAWVRNHRRTQNAANDRRGDRSLPDGVSG